MEQMGQGNCDTWVNLKDLVIDGVWSKLLLFIVQI